jgi:hypothetical protein
MERVINYYITMDEEISILVFELVVSFLSFVVVKRLLIRSFIDIDFCPPVESAKLVEISIHLPGVVNGTAEDPIARWQSVWR